MRQKNLSSQVLSVSYNGTLFKSLRGVYVIISFFSYTVPTTTVQTAKFMDIASSPQAYTVKTTFTGGFPLKKYMEERVIESATYIIEHNATVRQTAKQFGVSKSTVHKDVTERLETINKHLQDKQGKCLISTNQNVISEAEWQQKKNIFIINNKNNTIQQKRVNGIIFGVPCGARH